MSATNAVVNVQAVHYVPEDINNIIVEFLDSVDPKIIERTALSKMGWGTEQSVVALAIDVLKDLARGAVS